MLIRAPCFNRYWLQAGSILRVVEKARREAGVDDEGSVAVAGRGGGGGAIRLGGARGGGQTALSAPKKKRGGCCKGQG